MTKNGIIEQVVAAIPEDTESSVRDQLGRFIEVYYRQVYQDDLTRFGVDDLFGAALCHWELAQTRIPGQPALKIYNPNIQEDRWQTSHTVIDLVTDDMPYLVMSLSMTLTELGINIYQTIHPVIQVKRAEDGTLLDCLSSDRDIPANSEFALCDHADLAESLMHIEIDRITDPGALDALKLAIENTLHTLQRVHQDQDAIIETMQSLESSLSESAASCSEAKESLDLLKWIDRRNFSPLGAIELKVLENLELQPIESSVLGLFALDIESKRPSLAQILPADHTILFEDQQRVSISKSALPSPIIRPENLDVVVVRDIGGDDKSPSIDCVIGLFSPFVKNLDTTQVPVLRQKTHAVHTAFGHPLDSHAGKALANTLEQLPREMLFQHDVETLLQVCTGIVNLQERQRICLFGSVAPGGLHCDCLVYIPREHYSRELRLTIESILLQELSGLSSEFDSRFSSESALARIHYVIRLPARNQSVNRRKPDWADIEAKLIEAGITWEDRLLDTLLQSFDENQALDLHKEYRDAFPVSYKSDFSARIAQADIALIEDRLMPDRPMMHIYRNRLADASTLSFKLFSPGKHIALSDVIPVIENMGMVVDAEHPYHIKRKHAEDVWVHEFGVKRIDGKPASDNIPNEHLQTVFEKIWIEQVENDGFNRLILDPGLNWRESVVLRSYCKYLLQIGVPFSQSYMIDTLVRNANIAKLLVQLFNQRFDPAFSQDRMQAQNETQEAIRDNLSFVESLDEDRILRAYLNLITNTLRTNFFCQDEHGEALDYVSYKLDSSRITGLPLPRPHVEIFVYSPRVEGVHLRGGRVARGGLRWSDRREDFRTEVLGLMKAQMVKNAVIVPVGSKGGFYVKNPPLKADREAQFEEGVRCYQTFLRGMLDVTDNVDSGEIIPPPNVIRYDEDDPYLVVAADKGTATFSDYANAISEEYGFWLGDAFASGGSAGYDHKKMGITARGAWESVKRHFRELGSDTQTTPFTVVAIGDMAGDVFGNGMLLSDQIKLIAAFNHMHIFIDPDPDPEQSHTERARLFSLPRSTWSDYNEDLLSKGGAIYPRTLKEITLSPEAMSVLQISEQTLTPNDLIHHCLQAPTDLIWNGGIGTYIKSAGESHAAASDRANDGVRVNANQLRCRVIGEGGNLGVTQLARIDFARSGGLMYTDAIDNSAGVDCSDHEVNIKILLNGAVKAGDLTLKQRDQLLVKMTDRVGELVLLDNYLQTQCINIAHAENAASLEEHARFILHLETLDKLDREIEYLPSVDDIAERLANNQGLSRPELAVIVAYSKMDLYEQLLASKFSADTSLNRLLHDYFPEPLTEQFGQEINQHPLRAEIICTIVGNQLVNRLGPTFFFRMQEELGATAEQVAQSFVAVCEIFAMHSVWQKIESLDNIASAKIQTSMHILVRGLVERAVHWLLRSRRDIDSIDSLIDYFKPGISELIASMPHCLASANRKTLDERCAYFMNAGAPDDTALSVAQVVPLSSALDIVEISKSQRQAVAEVAAVYFELGIFLNLQWLRDEISQLAVRSQWHTLAKSELRSDIHYQQRHLCAEVINSAEPGSEPAKQVAQWSESNLASIHKYNSLITEMKAASGIDFAMLSLAVSEVHKLLRSHRPLANSLRQSA